MLSIDAECGGMKLIGASKRRRLAGHRRRGRTGLGLGRARVAGGETGMTDVGRERERERGRGRSFGK